MFFDCRQLVAVHSFYIKRNRVYVTYRKEAFLNLRRSVKSISTQELDLDKGMTTMAGLE